MTEEHLFERKGWPLFRTKASSLDKKSRRVGVVMSSSAVDRDGEVVKPKAFENRIETFKANPVVLWNHDPKGNLPIGTVDPDTIEITENDISGTVQFRDAGKDELADRVFSAVEDGVIKTVSIGFRVFDAAQEKNEDGEPTGPLTITDAELFELSFVPIPANTSAVVKWKDHLGLIDEARKANGERVKFVQARYMDVDHIRYAAAAIDKFIGREWPDEDTRTAIERLRMALVAWDATKGLADDPGDEVDPDLLRQILDDLKSL